MLGRGYSDFTQIDLFLIFVGSHEVLKNLISGSLYCTVLVLFCTPPPIFTYHLSLSLSVGIVEHQQIITYSIFNTLNSKSSAAITYSTLQSIIPIPTNTQAIIPFKKQTDAVTEIMNQHVAGNTKKQYTGHNVNFLFWLFDKDPERYLHNSILDNAYKENKKDEDEPAKGKNKRKYLRTFFQNCLSEVGKTENSCPVVLPNITFNVFSDYLA